jgi:hypothetical protein
VATAQSIPTKVNPGSEGNTPALDLSRELSRAALSVRLGLKSRSAISNREQEHGVNSDSVKEWIRNQDPDGLSWYKTGDGKQTRYNPIIEEGDRRHHSQ